MLFDNSLDIQMFEDVDVKTVILSFTQQYDTWDL